MIPTVLTKVALIKFQYFQTLWLEHHRFPVLLGLLFRLKNECFAETIRDTNPATKEISDHKVRIQYLSECFAESTLDIKLEIQNCKTAKTLICSDECTNIRREPIVNYVLVTDKALFLESVETGDKQHTAQFVADELERVAKVWCPAMTGDRNAMIGIDAICLDNPSVNKLATSLLKQKYSPFKSLDASLTF